MKFSIIIPAYNVAPYISRCLDSVVKDDYPDKEVIVVDDGSKDSLVEKVVPYTQKHPWIRLIRRENGGLSAARNTGMKHARGDYVVFLDADDFWLAPPLKRFEKIFSETDCDIIKADYVSVLGEKPQQKRILAYPYLEKKISSAEYVNVAVKNKHYECVVCAGAFRRSFLTENEVIFREGVKYEDHEFTLRCLLAGASVVQIPDQYYGYFVRAGGITKSPGVSSVADILFNFRMMRNAVENASLSASEKTLFRKPVAHIVYHALMVWWRLPVASALALSALFSSDILAFAKAYSMDDRTSKILKLFSVSPVFTYLAARIKIKICK